MLSKKWSKFEVDRMLTMRGHGATSEQIGKELGKTDNAVRHKIKRMRRESLKGSDSVVETHKTQTDLEKAILINGDVNRPYELMRRLKKAEKKVDVLSATQSIINQLFKDDSLIIQPKSKISLPNSLKYTSNKEDAFLWLSDQHIGETVDSVEMHNKNEYNIAIAEERMNNIVNITADIIKDKLRGYQIDTLHIGFGGDSISGEIHDELALNLEIPLPELVIKAGNIFANTVSQLSRLFKQVKVYCIVGNHGRGTREQNFKNRVRNNYELIVYEIMKKSLSTHKNVTVEVPMTDRYVVDINGHKCLLYHGTDIRGSGVPYAGGRSYLNSLKTSDFDFKSAFIAHFHTSFSYDYGQGKVFGNGSLIGSNEYSSGKMGIVLARPKQWLVGVHPERITWQVEIECDKKKVV